MKIWVTRHGQTKLNKKKLMQGLTDEPLNDIGRGQAKAARERIKDVKFDAVYASPLCRAIETASIIGNISQGEVIVDPRIIEVDFGRYEAKSYFMLGIRMSLYWACPEIFPVPPTVETIPSMVARSSEFLQELEAKEYENVLVVCHGGIIRAICGYLEDKANKIKWRPKPHNCEIRVYETTEAGHNLIATYENEKSK